MSIVLVGSTSGSITLQEPAVSGSTVLDLPAVSGTILTTTSPKAGNVIQVVQGFSSASFSTTSGSAVDITGLTATITPTSSSSKILIMSALQLSADMSNNPLPKLFLVRNGTNIYLGDAGDSRTQVSVGGSLDGGTSSTTANLYSCVSNYLDSPATTSALTYKWQVYTFSSRTIFVNRSALTADANGTSAPSSIILMEIAG